jgi:hypothetical protein
MDAEARALVERAKTTENPPKKKKRKRGEISLDQEIEYVQKLYLRLCSDGLKEKFFPGEPTLAEIGANNSEMRRNVACRMQIVEDEEAVRKRPLSAENQTNDVVLRDGLLFPPRSHYIQW